MPKGFVKYYSVYNRKTDMPVIIHAKTDECLRVTGVSQATFYCYVTRTRNGIKNRRYDIYVDEEDDNGEA